MLYCSFLKNSEFYASIKSKMKRFAILGIASFPILTMATSFQADAQAATATGTFLVTAIVPATCLITTTPMVFGSYTGLLLHSTATVIPICTLSTTYTVGLSAGTAPTATVSTRAMVGTGSTTLSYGLFRDGAWTLNWGTTTGTDTVPGTATGVGQPITVYGQVPAAQYPSPGNYTDTITATLTY